MFLRDIYVFCVVYVYRIIVFGLFRDIGTNAFLDRFTAKLAQTQ